MVRKQTTRIRTSRKLSGIEWIGGRISMPAYVTGDGEPYRPEAVLWMGTDGGILGSRVSKPGELLPAVSESLQRTIEQPMYGQPHAPTRVRVASPELADAVRAGHPEIEVVCAPTPEIDEMLALMREKLGEHDATEQSYLSTGIEPDAMASFFRAAAALFLAKPWKWVPDDQSLFSVTIEELGLHEVAMSVIGQMGQHLGLILFSDLDDFEMYLDAAIAIDLGQEPKTPSHFALNFEHVSEVATELRREVAKHNWEVASPNAYPWLLAVDEDLVARPPTAKELTMAEAIARALASVQTNKKALRAAWDGGEPVLRTSWVRTHRGEVQVTLRAPYGCTRLDRRPAPNTLADPSLPAD